MSTIILFTKPGCHLCTDALADLRALQRERCLAFQVVERNIFESLDDYERWKNEVPVALLDGAILFRYRLTPEAIEALQRRFAHSPASE